MFEGGDTRLAGRAQPERCPAERAKRHPCRPNTAANPSGIIAKGGTPLNAVKVHGVCLTYEAGGIRNQWRFIIPRKNEALG